MLKKYIFKFFSINTRIVFFYIVAFFFNNQVKFLATKNRFLPNCFESHAILIILQKQKKISVSVFFLQINIIFHLK